MQAKAQTIMSKNLITIATGSPLTEAISIMENFKIRHLPVLNEKNQILGVLIKRDFSFLQNIENTPVDFFMATPPLYMDQNTPLRNAILKILADRSSFLLITGNGNEVVGIVTTDDLLWYLAHLVGGSQQNKFSFSSLFDLQTIGEAAQQLALAGI